MRAAIMCAPLAARAACLFALGLALVSACGADADDSSSTTPTTATSTSGGSSSDGGAGGSQGGTAGMAGAAGAAPEHCGDGPCSLGEDCLSCPDDCGPCASGTSYYVSPTGSDTNPGTIDLPFLTVQKGADTVQPGDALYLRAGTYLDSGWFTTSGTVDRPIVVSGYPGEEVVFDGADYAFPPGDGSAFLTFVGDHYFAGNLTVTKAYDMGVVSQGQHNVLHNIYSHHNWGSGIILTGNYDVAQHCRVWSNSMMNENGSMPISWGTGISCARYPDYCTIRRTESWENWGEGISTFETMHTTIEDCVSYDNMQNFYISDTQHSILQRNLSYCSPDNPHAQYFSSQNGILVGDEKGVPVPLPDGPRQPSANNQIINNLVMGCCRNLAASQAVSTGDLYAYNTFVNATASCSDPANVMFYQGACEDARFTNNLVLQEDELPIALVDVGGVVFDHNLWSKEPAQAAAEGVGDVVGDPALGKTGPIGAGALLPSYFMLTESSAAIDAAEPSVPVDHDFFGTARGTAPDVGAHER